MEEQAPIQPSTPPEQVRQQPITPVHDENQSPDQNMTNTELVKLITAQQKKIDEMYVSFEKIRKMYLWSVYITIALIIIPAIIFAFVLPKYIGTLTGSTTLQNVGL